MKRKRKLLIILVCLVCLILILLCAGSLFGMSAVPGGASPSASSADGIFTLQSTGQLLHTGAAVLIGFIFLLLLLFILASIFLFPPAAVILAVFSIFRHRSIRWKTFLPPLLLLLISLCSYFAWNLFVNGSGYVFHHDWGSKVYNEGYIIPHYEAKYEDTLELADKNVIDSCNAIYTLRSKTTGKLFTVETRYFSEGSGSFDMLHLSDAYQEILGERLQAGERITLPFDDGVGLKLDDGSFCWFYLSETQDGYKLYLTGDADPIDQEFQDRVAGERFTLYLEGHSLVMEVPLLGEGISTHHIAIQPD